MRPPSHQLTAFSLKALDDEYLSGAQFRAAVTSTKASLLRQAHLAGDTKAGRAADSGRPQRSVHDGSPRTPPSGRGGGGGVKDNGQLLYDHDRRRAPPPADAACSFRPQVTSMHKLIELSVARQRPRSGSSNRSGWRRRKARGSSRDGAGSDTSATSSITNLRGEGSLKNITGSRSGEGQRSILKKQPEKADRSPAESATASVHNNSMDGSAIADIDAQKMSQEVLAAKVASRNRLRAGSGSANSLPKRSLRSPIEGGLAAGTSSGRTKTNEGKSGRQQHADPAGSMPPSADLSSVSRTSSFASACTEDGALYFRSLEDYLCEPVVERLAGDRRLYHPQLIKNVLEATTDEQAPFTHRPTLAPKSRKLNAACASPLLMSAQFRRQHMQNPPRTGRMRRSSSVLSSVWGGTSDFSSRIRPPPFAEEGPTIPLYITEKARKLDRSVADLQRWDERRDERHQERVLAAEAARQKERAAAEKEVYALQEMEYTRRRLEAAIAAEKRKRRHKAKYKKMSDFLKTLDDGTQSEVSVASRRSRSSTAPKIAPPPRLMNAHSRALVAEMADRRIDVYDHAAMTARAKAEKLVSERVQKLDDENAWKEVQRAQRRRNQSAAAAVGEGAVTASWWLSELAADPAFHRHS